MADPGVPAAGTVLGLAALELAGLLAVLVGRDLLRVHGPGGGRDVAFGRLVVAVDRCRGGRAGERDDSGRECARAASWVRGALLLLRLVMGGLLSRRLMKSIVRQRPSRRR